MLRLMRSSYLRVVALLFAFFGANRRGRASTTDLAGAGFVSVGTSSRPTHSSPRWNGSRLRRCLERAGLGALRTWGLRSRALVLFEKALYGYRRLTGREPPEAMTVRGKMAWSLYYLKRYREALAMFIRGSLGAPSSHQFQVGMGWCYLSSTRRPTRGRRFNARRTSARTTRSFARGSGAPASDRRPARRSVGRRVVGR
jgi:hypothetical protein